MTDVHEDVNDDITDDDVSDDVNDDVSKSEDANDGAGDDQGGESLESLAGEMGWAPKDQWRGNPDDWVDAAAFIRNGYTMNRKTLSRQDKELAEIKDTMKRMTRVQERFVDQTHMRDIDALKEQQRQAVRDADEEEFDRLQGLIDEAEEARQPTDNDDDKGGQTADPHFDDFVSRNPWYEDDYEMGAFADQIAPRVGRRFKGAEFYAEIEKAVRRKFPDAFGNKRRRQPARVEGGNGVARPGKRGKGYNDLPPEAKEACDNFVADKFGTKEEYCAIYFEDES